MLEITPTSFSERVSKRTLITRKQLSMQLLLSSMANVIQAMKICYQNAASFRSTGLDWASKDCNSLYLNSFCGPGFVSKWIEKVTVLTDSRVFLQHNN
jgi:hypothetical protein